MALSKARRPENALFLTLFSGVGGVGASQRTPQTYAKIFLEAGAATRPVPRGAGINLTETEPQVPLNFIGIV